jgi:hypothetical protein
MKNISSTVMVFLFIGGLSLNASSLTCSAGIKGGLAFSNIWGNYILDLDNTIENAGGKISGKSALTGYAFFTTQLHEYFGIETDIGFSMKGRTMKLDDSTGTTEIGINATYLEIPLLFKGSKSVGNVTPYVYYGPTFGILLSAKGHEKMTSNNGGFSVDSSYSLKESSRAFDVSVTMGGGVEINAGPGRIVADMRYNLSFMKVDKVIDPAVMSIARDLKFWNFNAMIGYLFKF